MSFPIALNQEVYLKDILKWFIYNSSPTLEILVFLFKAVIDLLSQEQT